MRLPPWAIEALRNGVADVARKASDAETIAKVKEQAKELLRELPENASRGIDVIVQTASDTARNAMDQGRETFLRWSQRRTEIARPCINASGILQNSSGSGVPVSDEVLQIGCDLLRGDCVTASEGETLKQRISLAMEKLFDSSGRHVAVANSLDAAVASLGILAQQRTIVIHRSQAIRLPSGLALPDAFQGLPVTECGGVQDMHANDFEGIDSALVVLADNGKEPVSIPDLGTADIIKVLILPVGTGKPEIDQVPDAQSLLDAGLDLVLIPGGPLTSGPESGLLFGRSECIQKITGSPRWKTYAASSALAAMSLSAMALSESSPLAALIETSEDNLRNRGERMAIRLTAEEIVASCQLTDAPATLVEGARWSYPSRQLRLRHKTLSAQQWQKLLASRTPAVLSKVDGEDLLIDLRWVSPAKDAILAESIAPSEEPPQPNAE